MAQSGYTPILIYASGTASNVPLAANLTSSASGAELALNYADGKLYFKNSSGVVTLLAGAGGAGVVAGSNTQIQFNNSGVFGASANLTWDGSKVTASAYQTGGNLTFTGTGNRITGDFTNATVASRVAFQTSTVNGNTTVNAIPNGTATSSQFITHNATDPGNSSRAGFNVGSTTALFFSDLTGTGTYLPMAFNTGGSERMRIDSSGNVGIGTSSPSTSGKLTVNGNVVFGGPSGRNTATSNYIGVWTTGDPVDDARANIGFTTVAGAASSSSYITFSTNSYGVSGGERMRIDSSGNVGIGFASGLGTYGQLEVGGNANPTMALRSSTASGTVFAMTAVGATEARINAITSVPMTFFTNNLERMRIDSSGNLLLGTSSGSARLVVNGGTSTSQIRWEVNNAAFVNEVSTNAAANAYVYKSNDASYHVWKISNSTAMVLDTSGRMYMSANAAYGNAKITLVPATNPTTGLSTNSQIQIGEATSNPAYCLNVGYGLFGDYYGYIQSKNNSLATSLLLNPDGGNVGIGTSAPSGKLDVRTAAGTSAVMNLSSGSNATVTKFNIGQAASIDWDVGISATAGNFYIGGLGGSMAEAYKIVRSGTSIDHQTWNTNSAERMRIDSSGNVGIGTSSPSGKLEVSSSGQNIVVSRSTGSYAAYQRTAPTGQQTYDFYTINGVEVARITGDPTYLGFSTGLGTERMRIDSSGNVGIGTGSPSSYGKFAVIGSGTTASTFSVVATDNAGTSNFTVRDDGLVTANKPAGLGYGTGSGGTVTQATSKSTAVTLNKPTGQITMNAAALAAGTSVFFDVNDSLVAATDNILLTLSNFSALNYTIKCFVSTGKFTVILKNETAGSLSEAVVFNFGVLKGATA